MNYIFCEQPFKYFEINDSGEVKVCCDKWCNNFSIGNIFDSDFEEIFNGEKLQELIMQFTSQKFNICNLDICPSYEFLKKEDYEYKFEKYAKITQKTIRLNYDSNCNLNCIFCGNQKLRQEPEKYLQINKFIYKILPYLNEQGWIISLNGVGEVFTSKCHLELIKHIVSNYPNIKFSLITNGILFTEKMIQTLNIEDRLETVEVSVHAYNEKTYKCLVKNGNFKILKNNLRYISRLKKDGKIKNFYMNFVVTSVNYKEMSKFIDWAKSLNAFVMFLPLLAINDISSDVYNQLNITSPKHPQYNDFVAKMQNQIFKQDKVSIPKIYLELKRIRTKNFIQKLFER